MSPIPTSLPLNTMHFARVLRRAGLPIGQDQVIAALEALQVIDIGNRDDVYWALHAVLIKRHAHSALFRAAFERFWSLPASGVQSDTVGDSAPSFSRKPEPISLPRRILDAFESSPPGDDTGPHTDDIVAASWSSAERLRTQDFETMSAEEWSEAKRLIATLRLPIPDVVTRRFRKSHQGPRIDMRATMRAMVRGGGVIDLKHKSRVRRPPPLVVLCDISGSMAAYARMLLHFLHAITNDRDRVHTFLFGTRLTNVTRFMARRDPDDALARVSSNVGDWSGGTRIGAALGAFNRVWARRVLAQGAVVLLITDGLDRDDGAGLGAEMRRLHGASRRLIWLNPLLRYDAFEPKSVGIRAMLPHVDDFRPVHNLDSLASLIAALGEHPSSGFQSHRAA